MPFLLVLTHTVTILALLVLPLSLTGWSSLRRSALLKLLSDTHSENTALQATPTRYIHIVRNGRNFPCVCMRVYMYVCVCVHACVRACVCTCTCVYVRMLACVST